jgi:hypothetical protein
VPTILAATGIAGKAGEILIAGSLLVIFFLALGVGLWYYRRWRGEPDPPSSVPWTLDDLRKLRAQGMLTDTEYQALRDTIIGLHTGEPPAAATREIPRPAAAQKEADEEWDWVAEEDPRSGGFDVKK